MLTNYNGNNISYDQIGNPLDDGTWTYTWQHGRQLAAMTKKDGSATWNYTYGADGLRLSRSNGSTNYRYFYYNGQLLSMIRNGTSIYIAYSPDGKPLSVVYSGATYYYVTNLQGDVIAILDQSGNPVVRYTYDAWGNQLSCTGSMASTLGTINPLRYRGYVYDQETNLYYLQSRYYNPELGRFINADGLTSTGQGFVGNNMFAYCLNNPVILKDIAGFLPTYILDTDGDDVEDCYVYTYTYKIVQHARGRRYSKTITGCVYIYKGFTTNEFLAMPTPEGFSESTDLMVLNLTENTDNPTLLARQAHKVNTSAHKPIVECMKKYDDDFLTKWNRTTNSLLSEWTSHNVFASFSVSAQNIDFDNKEEGKGFGYYVKKALNRAFAK